MTRSLFISDLHLDPERPVITGLFLDYLASQAGQADAIYILGDLFEAWIGDDDDSSPAPEVINALSRCARSGTAVFVMHGNRDFLLGDTFARAAECTLLPDPSVISLNGTPTLLMHGDLLCTDDTGYQQFRSMVHACEWQSAMLARPLPERRAIAQQMRKASREENSGKSEAIMDVNQLAVENTMRMHNTMRLIHGHTHRPAVHDFTIDDKPAQRIVLGDWYEQGSVLVCDSAGCSLQTLQPATT